MIRWVTIVFLLLSATACSQLPPRGGSPDGVVVLDIGHSLVDQGARAPGVVQGKRLTECSFWYQYAYYVKRVVQKAGYRCVVINRGNAPETEPLLSYARRAKVLHMRRPDVPGERYPSRYHPDRVASGMVSADYAIWKRAACIVFLHHNSSSSRWARRPSRSMILCNKFNGKTLADTLGRTLDAEILDHGMPNGGLTCRSVVRSVDAERSAGWMNACDDSGIPAAVIEAAFLNNRSHVEFLSQEKNARRYAEAIGHGIVRYMRQHGHDARHYRADENAPDEGSFGYARESRRLTVPGAKRLLP